MFYYVCPYGYLYFLTFIFMSKTPLEIFYESDDLIPRIERCIELTLGYKQDIYNILCYTVNHLEIKCQKFVEKVFRIRAIRRIKQKHEFLSHNPKLLCSPK